MGNVRFVYQRWLLDRYHLKVALIQHKNVPKETVKNLELGLDYMKESKALGADHVLFLKM